MRFLLLISMLLVCLVKGFDNYYPQISIENIVVVNSANSNLSDGVDRQRGPREVRTGHRVASSGMIFARSVLTDSQSIEIVWVTSTEETWTTTTTTVRGSASTRSRSSTQSRSSTAPLSSSEESSTQSFSSAATDTTSISEESSTLSILESTTAFVPSPTPMLTVESDSKPQSTGPPSTEPPHQSSPSATAAASSPSDSTTHINPDEVNDTQFPVAAVVGPVAGGFIFALLAWVFIRYHIRNRSTKGTDEDDLPGPYPDVSYDPNNIAAPSPDDQPYHDGTQNVYKAPSGVVSELGGGGGAGRFYSHPNQPPTTRDYQDDDISPFPTLASSPQRPSWPIRNPTAPGALHSPSRPSTTIQNIDASTQYHELNPRPSTSRTSTTPASNNIDSPHANVKRQATAPMSMVPPHPPISNDIPAALRPGSIPADYGRQQQQQQRRSTTPPWSARPGYENGVPRW